LPQVGSLVYSSFFDGFSPSVSMISSFWEARSPCRLDALLYVTVTVHVLC